jgi:hypothetical protein
MQIDLETLFPKSYFACFKIFFTSYFLQLSLYPGLCLCSTNQEAVSSD